MWAFSSVGSRGRRWESLVGLVASASLLAAGAADAGVAGGAGAALPPAHRCPARPGIELEEGRPLGPGTSARLARLLPAELQEHAETLFGPRGATPLGSCYRRYPIPWFYREATRRHAGRAHVDGEGNLHGYVAGLPFPVSTLASDDPRAAARWAWNLAARYRGAGPAGRFRIVDVNDQGRDRRRYAGHFFFLRTAHRADRRRPGDASSRRAHARWLFAAGGRFESPFSARHLAWRQLRPLAVETDSGVEDDIFVYAPSMRRPERSATAWVDGLFVPRYTVSGSFGDGQSAGPGGIHLGLHRASAVREDIRRGLTGLALRPNAYDWAWLETRDVLAPLNAAGVCRGEGGAERTASQALGLEGAAWDLRRAVVLEGVARRAGRRVPRLTLYVDLQTQQPLFHVARAANGKPTEVGVLVHRYSGDVEGYPRWPDGSEARVFDPVASVHFRLGPSGASWRRESCEVVSVPPSPRERALMLSVSALTRGR